MANSRQARKRARQNLDRYQRNKPYRTRANHTVRDARVAIAEGAEEAPALVREAQSALDRAARRNIIHPNEASRKKHRLAQALKEMQTAS